MTEVGGADLSRILQTKRDESRAIVTSRKRKLRELFAVATQADALPSDGFTNHPDVPSATPTEWHFLQANDMLHGKTLNELTIPARPTPRPSLEKLIRSVANDAEDTTGLPTMATRAGAVKNDSLKVQDEAPSPETPSAKKRDHASAMGKDMKPVSYAKTTPIPQPLQPPSQNRLRPGRPTEASSNPVTLPEPSTVHGDDGTTQKLNGGINGLLKEGGIARQAMQVKFPPGTKSSPSTNAAKDEPVGLVSSDAPAQATDGKADAGPTGVRTGSNGPLSIKLPSDTYRIPDAVSTPGSTAASATTPAVHDASTDTSPDHDSSRYADAVERKEPGASTDVNRLGDALDVQGRASGVDHQLLKESAHSSMAASPKPKGEKLVVALAPTPDAFKVTHKPQLPVTVDVLQPASVSSETQQPSPSLAILPPLAEVPDSQGSTPEQMDVDAPEVKAEARDQKDIVSSQEQNLPARDAPTTPFSDKAQSRGQLQASERAVTRVSSGAMRRKSVNEIVGGLSRPPNNSNRDAVTKGTHDQLTPVTSTPQSPASRVRRTAATRKARIKGHSSTVLFGKRPKRVEDKALVPGHKETIQPSDDYYTPLFVQNFSGSSSWMQPLERLLFQANKTISTPDAHLVIQDHQACRVLRRVYHLQQHDKWSLRQPKRCLEPTRPPSQRDVLLQEMKWMRTDFREERKWKMAVARNLSYACAEWHAATPEERKCRQVAAVIPPKGQAAEHDVSLVDADEDGADNQPTPELVSSGDVDSPQIVDDLVEDFVETVAPSAIFALQEDDVVFGLRRTAASDKLLDELPIFGAPLEVPKFDMTGAEYDPEAHWRRPALPLSKFVEGEMRLVYHHHPQKRSRYDYGNDDDDDDDDREGDFIADRIVHTIKLAPSTDEVSLFNPESKHIRDRLHAGHQFRPPSEHPMPTQSFYESRSPSQWTMAEDDELRGLVREYSYNWSLISSMLSTKSFFVAGAERRTPWECFERWINLEGLPADMQKTQYFKAYNNRIEAAQRMVAQQNQLAAQQAAQQAAAQAAAQASASSVVPVTPVRRRPTTIPLRVERRRNQKHLTMLDAMRKLAKKRETAMQKQQHSGSQNAANKKNNDTIPQRPAKTPRDYSLIRWERDQALAEKMAQYAQRQEAQRRAALQARAQAQGAPVAGAPGAGVPGQNANHVGGNPGANGAGRHIPNQLVAAAVAASQGRPRVPMQGAANGVAVGGAQPQMNGSLSAPAQLNGAPQAQMHSMQGQQRMAMSNQQPDASLMLRAQRISEQQRAAVQIQQQAQQQQHHNHHHNQQQQQQGNPRTPGAASQHGSPAMRNGAGGFNQQNFMNNAQALMASYTAAAANGNGHAMPQANGLHMPSAASASSPGQRVHSQLPPSITAQLNHLEASFRAKNPDLTPEQVRQLATEQLTRAMMAQRQNAMNAAAGAAGQPGIANSIAATTSPHQYAALLRQQQQAQQQQQQHHLHPHRQQKQPLQQKHSPIPQTGSAPLTTTPAAASASPVQSHQRASSGSATPSAAAK